jgi:membrane-associated protease RseP (regulator of RpoE activity)
MKRFLVAFLVLLVLFLAASNARLLERERLLEERLAAAERRKAPKRATEATAPAVEVARAERPTAPASPPEPGQAGAATAAIVPPPVPPPAAAKAQEGVWAEVVGGEKRYNLLLHLDPKQGQLQGSPALIQAPLTLQAEEFLPEGRKPGYLGISGGDAQGGGAQVTDVFPTGVAGAAGLRSGDVIVEYNGESVQGLADLARRVRLSGEGAPISLRIRRDGNEFYQGVQLGPRP